MDINEIKEILPHRYPFLLVDKVLKVKNEKIKALKQISINENIFNGHFPDFPIYPGVMIVEGLAQTGGLLAFSISNITKEELQKKLFLFTEINNVKFRLPVKPGDTLIYKVKILSKTHSKFTFQGSAYVDKKLVCQAEFQALIINKQIK